MGRRTAAGSTGSERERGLLRACRVVLAAIVLIGALVVLGTASTSASGEAIVRSSGPRDRPVVALTFDDGNSPQNCRRILAELVARGVPATFFPLAAAMPLDVGFWRTVGEIGDPVGDHTLTHPDMPTLTLRQQEWQIAQGRILAESILGRPLLRVFRPPYGAYDAETLVAANATGFPIALLWDVDTRDWARTHTLAQMLAAAERGRDGSVVLMHCGPDATPYLVPEVIDYYRSKGFGFVTIPELLGLAWRPGPTQSFSPRQILGGLSPLPPLPSGGPTTGPDGYGLSPSPAPSTTSMPSSPPVPSEGQSPPPVAGTNTPPASPSIGPGTSTPSVDAVRQPTSTMVVPWILVVGLASAVAIALSAAVAHRRRR